MPEEVGDPLEEHGHEAPTPDAAPPASALTAIGVMGLAAVVVVAAVVGWARLSSPRGVEEDRAADELPTRLAGDLEPADVPDAVAAAVDGPVLGARVLDEAPAGVGCDMGMDVQNASFEGLLITTDGALAVWVGDAAMELIEPPLKGAPPPPRPVPPAPAMEQLDIVVPTEDDFIDTDPGREGPVPPDAVPAPPDEIIIQPQRMVTWCELAWENGRWENRGGGGSAIGDDVSGLGSGFTCCDRDGFGTAHTWLPVTEGATWALQERNGWWLAYPVGGRRHVGITWKSRQTRFGSEPSHVLFVNEAGEIFDERFVGV